MNILLPTDFSENSKNAAVYALKFFEKTPCTFHLLHALPATLKKNAEEMHMPVQFYTDFEQFLRLLNSKKTNSEHEFKFVFKANHLIEAVREEVLEKKIDLIIMSTKGTSNQSSTFIGKNTSDVMMKVKCPVLAISENARFKKYREILFPTDHKIHYNGEMLDILLKMASLSNASVKILEIFESKKEPSFEQKKNRNLLQNYFFPFPPTFQPYYSRNDSDSIFNTNFSTDMIVLAAKNLNISQKLLDAGQNNQIPFVNQLPLLVLH